MMDSTRTDTLAAPRFETGKAMLVAGVGERYNHADNGGAAIPSQWQKFHHKQAEIPDRVGKPGGGCLALMTLDEIKISEQVLDFVPGMWIVLGRLTVPGSLCSFVRWIVN